MEKPFVNENGGRGHFDDRGGIATTVGNVESNFVAKASETLQTAKKGLKHGYDGTNQWLNKVSNKQPVTLVGIALGAGIGLGLGIGLLAMAAKPKKMWWEKIF